MRMIVHSWRGAAHRDARFYMGLVLMTAILLSDGAPANGVDAHGDALPTGVITRLGTIRLRHGLVHSVAFGPKGDFIVSAGSTDFCIRVWETRSGREIAAFETHEDEKDLLASSAFAVAVAPDGDLIAGAAGLENCCVYLYSLSTRKCIGKLRSTVMEGVKHLRFSSDGQYLACSGLGDVVLVWDVAKQKVARHIFTDRTQEAVFTPDSKRLVVAGRRQLDVYELASGKSVMKVNYGGYIESMDLSPDGSLAACVLHGVQMAPWY